jgi:hypothetical protein
MVANGPLSQARVLWQGGEEWGEGGRLKIRKVVDQLAGGASSESRNWKIAILMTNC